ncbi:ABC transporter ATP-binding protein [Inquilinus sp. CAU 1745]|uniref:ABC transporter ATP-binding protein n=1 Tax=Inquilinus sp. CAU 1745 TaxID=3140369 RepID=UPI00325A878E
MTARRDDILLDVRNLDLGVRPALSIARDVSFTVSPGEIVALVGESGSGKTMVARAVLDLLPSPVAATGGQVTFGGQDLSGMTARSIRSVRGARIGMVFQEPMTSLNPALTIGRQLEEGLKLHTKLKPAERKARILAMLDRVGIAEGEKCLKAFPHQFSGGMRQRIMLASVMLLKPALLVADEPTTALDALVQRDVLELMVELTRENGTAILLISHDLSMVARYADKVVVMHQGEVVEQGRTEDILLSPRHDYTRKLLDAMPRRQPARPASRTESPIVEVRDMTVDYPGRRRMFGKEPGKRAVDGVSLAVLPGETVAVVGGSGSGKTTLGRSIIGLVKPSGGGVLFDGVDPFGGGRDRVANFRAGCQIIFQDPYSSLDPRMRVGAIVAEALRHQQGLDATAKQRRVSEVLAEVGLDDGYADRFPHQLSGGQRQRVAIARAIVRKPSFIIADEPVSALDMTVQKQILELFARLQRQYGFACLFISHDLGAVEQVADRVLVMQHGKIVESGPRDAVFDRPEHPYTRRLLSAIPALEPMPGGGFRLRNRHAVDADRLAAG